MKRGLNFLTGMGVGAWLMYMMDPKLGRRRRSLLRDQMVSAACQFGDYLDATWRDIRHRTQGVVAETTHLFSRDHADDRVITERIRSKIGRYVSHPHAIHVDVHEGCATVSGPVLAQEVDQLLAAVASVRGVRAVESRLEVHEEAGNISALQGGRPRSGEPACDFLQQNWAPATRFLAGALGGGLMANCLARRDPLATLLGVVGAGLVLRSVTNTQMTCLARASRNGKPIEVHKTITVNAPVEQVFDFWTKYENFPRFMSHLREVRDLGDGRSHWTAKIPSGATVSWNAVITRLVPNEVLEWRSEPGSAIDNAGCIRFETTPEGATRVNIRLTYHPPGGALGHFAARLFGADPKSLMDEDLVRFKGLIEEGKTRLPEKGQVLQQEILPNVSQG